MKKKKITLLIVAAGTACAALPASAQVAAGGPYTLEQVVIANGGGSHAGGSYGITGTSGQSPAADSRGTQYAVRGGFWSQAPLAPTAAQVSVGGRVIRNEGIGIKGVQVLLWGGTLSSPRVALTNNMGYFSFDDIEVGQTYFLGVKNDKYHFANNTRAFTLMDAVSDIVFEASWEIP